MKRIDDFKDKYLSKAVGLDVLLLQRCLLLCGYLGIGLEMKRIDDFKDKYLSKAVGLDVLLIAVVFGVIFFLGFVATSFVDKAEVVMYVLIIAFFASLFSGKLLVPALLFLVMVHYVQVIGTDVLFGW